MPSLPERLQEILLLIVRTGTRECAWCEGTKVVTREYVQGQGMVDYDPPKACAHCDGHGVEVPAPDSLYVVGNMAATLLNLAIEARDREQYGVVDELLDWGKLYLAPHMPRTEAEVSEALTAVQTRLCEADAAIEAARRTSGPAAPAPGGALSDDELAELLGDAVWASDEQGRRP